MRRIFNRNEFIRKNNVLLTEALANDVNWGDSLVGRLINSVIRKAGIGINLRKLDSVIKRLTEQFDLLKDTIKVKNTEDIEVVRFYLFISALLGNLIDEIEDESNSLVEIISSVEGTIYEITYEINAPKEEMKKEKKIVLEKLNEFLEYLKSIKGESVEVESEDSESESEKSKNKNILSLSDGSKDSDDSVGNKILSLPSPTIKMKLPIDHQKFLLPVDKLLELEVIKNILSLDVSKQDIKELPSIIERVNKSIVIVHKSIEKEVNPKGKNLSEDQSKKLKSLFDNLTKRVHPDRIRYTGMSEEDANMYQQKLNDINEKKDLELMIEFDKYIRIIEKLIQVKKEATDRINQINKKNKEVTSGKNDLAPVDSKNESKLIVEYSRFILERKDNLNEDLRVKFDEIFTEDFMKKYQVTKSPQELDKEMSSNESSITIDPIIEIVKIFNRAYKLHTPGVISSGRRSGKVSNKVFKEYEYIGKGADNARMASEGGVEPGTGPYRNRSIFDKWENAVLDIIKDPKYQEIFNANTYFHFSPSDPRYNKQGKKEGGGKALLKFMNDMLDGSSLYREGAQSKFISKYFDVDVNDGDLGYTSKEKVEIERVSSEVKDEVSLVFKPYKNNFRSASEMSNSIFKMRDSEDKEWYFKVIEVKDDVVYFIMTLGFPYKLKIQSKFKELMKDGKVYVSSSNYKDFENEIIKNKKVIILEDKRVDDLLISDKKYDFSNLEILIDESVNKPFKGDSRLRSDLSSKSEYIKKNKEEILDRLK